MPPASAQSNSRRLGDFELGAELGRGGMGVVYAARQVSLNRKVAVKVLAAGLAPDERTVERFRREAEAAAKLHHTNVVPVYAVGEQDGTHFYAMELIEGPSLDRVLDGLRRSGPSPMANAPTSAELATTGPLLQAPATSSPVESALPSGPAYFDVVARMVAEIADALDHAHKQGVIHRDLKPANLLLSADGRLSINDFGLARVCDQPGLTQVGELLGTPSYASPEQIAPGNTPLDHRTDVYSLGATLYELLTLRPPFVGERIDQLLAQIIQNDPVPPRQLNATVPRDLETICLKCLEKEPSRRYQTGQELAQDLKRYVDRHAIQARRASPIDRLRKWCRRHPAASALLAALLLALLGVGFFAWRTAVSERERAAERSRHEQELRTERRRAALERALERAMVADFVAAERAIDEAVEHGASKGEVRLLRGQVALHRGHTGEALEHLEEAARLLPDSVAAQAILCRAYHDAGHFDRFYVSALELEKMKPRTAEDHLFQGYALVSFAEPKRVLPLLNRAVEMRPGPIARLVRAEALITLASDVGTAEDVERAIEEASFVKKELPGNPIAAALSLDAYLTAACAYEVLGLADKRKEALRLAGREAAALGEHPPTSRTVRVRLLYFDYVGGREGRDGIVREHERTKDSPAAPLAARSYFHLLFAEGKFAEALVVLERAPPTGDAVMHDVRRAFALAHLPDDGPARAYAVYEGHRQARQGEPFDARLDFNPAFILALLGRKAEMVEVMKVGAAENRDVVNYLAGLISEEKVLAVAGTSRWLRCENHYYVAMSRLAGGDRRGAREHFQKAVAMRVLGFLEYEWSLAFLTRLDADEDWPASIQAKR